MATTSEARNLSPSMPMQLNTTQADASKEPDAGPSQMAAFPKASGKSTIPQRLCENYHLGFYWAQRQHPTQPLQHESLQQTAPTSLKLLCCIFHGLKVVAAEPS